jgi:hypothetical protein
MTTEFESGKATCLQVLSGQCVGWATETWFGENIYKKIVATVRAPCKENTKTRRGSFAGAPPAGQGGGRRQAGPLGEAARQAVRDAWDQFLKPYLRG